MLCSCPCERFEKISNRSEGRKMEVIQHRENRLRPAGDAGQILPHPLTFTDLPATPLFRMVSLDLLNSSEGSHVGAHHDFLIVPLADSLLRRGSDSPAPLRRAQQLQDSLRKGLSVLRLAQEA